MAIEDQREQLTAEALAFAARYRARDPALAESLTGLAQLAQLARPENSICPNFHDHACLLTLTQHLLDEDILTDHLGGWDPPSKEEAQVIARSVLEFMRDKTRCRP